MILPGWNGNIYISESLLDIKNISRVFASYSTTEKRYGARIQYFQNTTNNREPLFLSVTVREGLDMLVQNIEKEIKQESSNKVSTQIVEEKTLNLNIREPEIGQHPENRSD